jgi:cobyrinic acid a,c-diamide synthase
VAAGSSGSGKTSFTCGLLKALRRRGLKPAAFKCGPDFIDPMFHRAVTGTPSSNLDLFLLDENTTRRLLAENSRGRDIAVMEGVMGLYDGLSGASDEASTWHIARATETPVILLEDCGKSSLTAAARIKGLVSFREPAQVRGRIRGVVLNRTGEKLCRELRPIIEGETGVPVLGFLPPLRDCAIESRHLGLVTAEEIPGLEEKIEKIAAALEASVDIDALLNIARSAPPLDAPEQAAFPARPFNRGSLRIGVARDRAFCFYYEDGLELLRRLGAELIPFSPMADPALPPDLSGLYLGGGYPELHAKALAHNAAMRGSVREALAAGLPCIAECGGFMYLHQSLDDQEGAAWPMAGVLPGGCKKTSRLVRFGYAIYTARKDNLLCRAGETLRGHEFHYWESDDPGGAFLARKRSGAEWPAVVAAENLFAGFPHFHFCSNPAAAERFLEQCAAYRQNG